MTTPDKYYSLKDLLFGNIISGIMLFVYYLIALGIAAAIIHFGGFSGTTGARNTYIVFAIIGVIGLIWAIDDIVKFVRVNRAERKK